MKLTDCELDAINASLPGDLVLHEVIGAQKLGWQVADSPFVHVREIFSKPGEVSFTDSQLYHRFLSQECYARIICGTKDDKYIDYSDEEEVAYWDTVMTLLKREDWFTRTALDSIANRFGITDVAFFDMTVEGDSKDYKIYAAWIEDESVRKNQ